MNIIITNPANRVESEYSIKCGPSSDHKHFNHHSENNPSPCNNPQIGTAWIGTTIQISHLDADTLIGIMRLLGLPLPTGLDFALMEHINNDGSSNVPLCDTVAFMVAVSDWTYEHMFPRCPAPNEVSINVTAYLEDIIYECKNLLFIKRGYASIKQSETNYAQALKESSEIAELYAIKEEIKFNPPKVCRSPRGIDFLVEDAQAVFDAIS